MLRKNLKTKWKEAMSAVLPIAVLMLILSLTIAPIPSGTMLSFLLGAVLLMVGMMLFSIGAEVAMEPMGQIVGAKITQTRNLKVILLLSFFLGLMITVSEPDLQVLANQVQDIPNLVLILAVGIGVGLFLMLALVRMLFSIHLNHMLIGFYLLVLVLACLAPQNFLAIAFDSGGVTTGPMTVPFIMSFGVGIAAIRNDKHAADDSFGLVALCSIGPIMAVLLLSMIFRADGAEYSPIVVTNAVDSMELRSLFGNGIPVYLKEMLISILPISIFFFVYNAIRLKLDKHSLRKIGLGLIYTYVGLTIFMTGANYGFMPAGAYLGQILAALPYRWILVPVGMLIGFFIVKAEPAVYVLMHQVEELTDGAIRGKSLQTSLCAGVSVSVGLAMLRVLTGLNILWLLIPGYGLALIMSFFTPKIFTAIAFDSGGVASGPMTAAFLLPLAMGACTSVGGNMATDAFGVVSMVAMTPLLTIQGLGIMYRIRQKKHKAVPIATDLFADLPENAIIEL